MIYTKTDSYELHKGTMQEVLDTFEENCIDSIVCDPPYELNFMSKGWDRSGVAFQKETWERCYKVLKPGGYLLAFGGTRTYHRICCAIEDAGFEIRDCIMWLYGSGFPKSQNVGKQIEAHQEYGKSNSRSLRELEQERGDNPHLVKAPNNGMMGEMKESMRKDYTPNNEYKGYGTCLKPAYEPVIVARKPLAGTVAENMLTYGVGAINIDECRVPFEDTQNPATNPLYRYNAGYKLPEKGQESNGAVAFTSSNNDVSQLGRFPANVITDGSEEVAAGMPETDSAGGATTMPCFAESGGSKLSFGQNENPLSRLKNDYVAPCDSGSAIRYFYAAKASKKDRDEGLDEFEEISPMEQTGRKEHSLGLEYIDEKGSLHQNPYAGTKSYKKNIHPTVKPTDLMQYLVRLVSPKGSKVLDCFMGSGSTGKACMYENNERNANYYFVGVEMTEDYLPIAAARIEYAKNNINNQMTVFDAGIEDTKKYKGEITEQGSIFDLM